MIRLMFQRRFCCKPQHAVLFIAAVWSATVAAQGVDVRAGEAAVGVDERGVEIDVDAERSGRELARPAARGLADRDLADWFIADQRAVIELAEFGQQRTKTPEVRQWMEDLAQQHQQLIDRMTNLAQTAANRTSQDSAGDAAAGREGANAAEENRAEESRRRGGEDRPLQRLAERVEQIADRAERTVDDIRGAIEENLGDLATRSGAGGAGGQLHREISDQFVAEAKQDLERRAGAEFDAALVGMLAAMELRQAATLQVIQRYADDELRPVIDQASKTVRQHRQRAERVMESIQP